MDRDESSLRKQFVMPPTISENIQKLKREEHAKFQNYNFWRIGSYFWSLNKSPSQSEEVVQLSMDITAALGWRLWKEYCDKNPHDTEALDIFDAHEPKEKNSFHKLLEKMSVNDIFKMMESSKRARDPEGKIEDSCRSTSPKKESTAKQKKKAAKKASQPRIKRK